MSEQNSVSENEICIHIFSVSAGLIGVCLTVIGIFRAVTELKKFTSVGDNLLAIDALFFLWACVISYLALRSTNKDRKRKIERVADVFFLAGLSLMAIICILIAYTFA